MAQSREIRRRIKATQNISKITKAMELVAAAKMRKAQAQAIASRSYAKLSGELLRKLAAQSDLLSHPLIKRVLPDDQKKVAQKILVVLITSNRGLAGALNTNVVSKALDLFKSEGIEKIDLVTVGKKAVDAARRLHLKMVAAFESKDKNLSILDAKPIAELAMNDFLSFKYEKVFVVYTDFISTLTQKPSILQILPFSTEEKNNGEEILFEPSPDEVLDRLVYHTIEFAVYQCLVEAVASEHSARMMAMRNANEAAGDLIDDLTLSYNQARQAGITKELSEISAAKLAMEG